MTLTPELKALRHSTAHLLASAVQKIYPDVKFGNGPATEEGFFYDFELEHKLTPEDFPKIEKEMKKIAKQSLPYECETVSRQEAEKRLKEMHQDYKLVTLSEIPQEESITFYKHGSFQDLCEGPHIKNSKELKAFKLLRVSGAYWKGSEKNKMLQRVYGTAFLEQSELDQYLHQIEEAKKRDHRVLGKQLDLFSFHPEAPANVFWHPKGAFVYQKLIEEARAQNTFAGYQEISTPLILNEDLWHRSGHWDHYQENMYFTKVDEVHYAVKPMNCPGACLVYKNDLHSYRELPLKLSEFGRVHRYEKSGVTHGLFRVRSFVQDDAHVYCMSNQIEQEVQSIIHMIQTTYQKFEFKEVHIELSTKPEKAIGSDQVWEQATQALKNALENLKLPYQLNPGDGAFYGPKIDFHVKDSLDRSWQCGTIQVDFSMPERFELSYVGEDGKPHQPVMIHRAVYGSIERFLGILIEHFAGAFPFWLAPVQCKILPISDKFQSVAEEWSKKLKDQQVRVEIDSSAEKIGYKIRSAQTQKIPYMLILGQKEVDSGLISVRHRHRGDLGSFTDLQLMETLGNESQTSLAS